MILKNERNVAVVIVKCVKIVISETVAILGVRIEFNDFQYRAYGIITVIITVIIIVVVVVDIAVSVVVVIDVYVRTVRMDVSVCVCAYVCMCVCLFVYQLQAMCSPIQCFIGIGVYFVCCALLRSKFFSRCCYCCFASNAIIF